MPGLLEDRIVGAESGGSATARNPRSSATGAGQFIDSTWLDMVGRYRPDLMTGSRADVLALRNDPALSREMVGRYADENGAKLRSAGLPDNDGTRYLSHFAGPAGARAVLSADPSTPVPQVLQPGQVAANPFVRSMTAGQLTDWAARKVGGSAPIMTMPGSDARSGQFGVSGVEASSALAPVATMPASQPAAPPIDYAALMKMVMQPGSAAQAPAQAPEPSLLSRMPSRLPAQFDASRFWSLLGRNGPGR